MRGVPRPIGEFAGRLSGVGMVVPLEDQLAAAVCSACARQRFASSILNPFSLCGLAPRIAASAALRKLAASADCPTRADSASGDRHGLVPTPPSAMRARVTFPPVTDSTTAAEARANSYEARSRSFR